MRKFTACVLLFTAALLITAASWIDAEAAAKWLFDLCVELNRKA